MKYKIVCINPGSTSTKVGVFEDEKLIFEGTVRHSKEELDQFSAITDQADMRLALITKLLADKGIDIDSMDAYVGRGGIISPLESGVYTVNDKMVHDLKFTKAANHASCLGGLFAKTLSDRNNKPCFVVDPVVVDERIDIAKVSGIPGYDRSCVFHPLNQKAVARKYAKENGKSYFDCRLIVAHMGGGITVGAHEYGKVIDVNDGFNGEGPFSPERCGGMQADTIIKMCFSGDYTKKDMLAFVNKRGGVSAHMNTNDMREVERLYLAGDEMAVLIFSAMAYNVAKEIGAMSAVMNGNVEAIILTGGLAYSEVFTKMIIERVKFIAPVTIYPGEDELLALCQGALRVLHGEEKAREYQG
ncbi:MAG: butyrate kinase [Clostridiales bacterium]|nr:butyrate kinase [Clostridiales bacterium]